MSSNVVYALHRVCIAQSHSLLMSLAWRPASLSVRAFATSVFLLYGCCPGKQWPIDRTRNSQDNMNMLQHASSCFRHFAPRQQSGASGHLYITIYTAGSEHPCNAKKNATKLKHYIRSLDSLDNATKLKHYPPTPADARGSAPGIRQAKTSKFRHTTTRSSNLNF